MNNIDNGNSFHLLEGMHLRMLEGVMKRLYTETRMDGNEMRDAAHTIRAVIEYAKEMRIPKDADWKALAEAMMKGK